MRNRWITLEGAVNVRDLGGLPTDGGGVTRFGRVLRSDNLQDLTEADVSLLAGELGIGHVLDLRTEAEVQREGPGPLTLAGVAHHHLSLFSAEDDPKEVDVDAVLPWQKRDARRAEGDRSLASYQGYLRDRADSVLAALRVMAHEEGGSIVHCAAGKDRTGVISALALSAAGVRREAVVADYALTAERLDAILDRLMASATYRQSLSGRPRETYMPSTDVMVRFLDGLDASFGGPLGWLDAHGWTRDDTGALRARLVG
ncbi:tyrosine-protein phosphatase [Actinocorallia sp. A-T 12471]|uniref:tyrosine-protein phosphatase n=1 Tax=Actinocorallia sp. A-T 12471 TaxID=3089813 RepID=UPI0029D2A7FC|nr:tyrosine-protein phosphatase [Actinocorallia sp. A-T 12471]MDX6741241.1 tyrosine-protein phosphatase [Actinocorallia sp. A-T 12471]